MSKATQTIQFLAHYNSWRRGDETLEMPSPAEIGATIDDAVNLLRRYDQLERRTEAIERALRDAISTYTGSDKVVSAERIEAWHEALQ